MTEKVVSWEVPSIREILEETKKDKNPLHWNIDGASVSNQAEGGKILRRGPIVMKWIAHYKDFTLKLEVFIKQETKFSVKSNSVLRIFDRLGIRDTYMYSLVEGEHGAALHDQGEAKLGELQQFLAQKRVQALKLG